MGPLQALFRAREQTYAAAVADGRDQLSALLAKDVLACTDIYWLRQYPRYLRAAVSRFEKLPSQTVKDEQYGVELAELARQFRQFAGMSDEYPAAIQREINKYRFMIEEYRVSLFAQHLKTAVPVSARRLARQADLIKQAIG